MSEIVLSRKVDEFVKPYRWIASLSNGETIFEDRRPGCSPAWERLASYVSENKLAITRMRLQLGHLEVNLPPHAKGYVQKKKVMATWAWSKEQYGVGYVDGGKALIHYVGNDGSSWSEIENDPGHPFTIYDCRGNG